MGQVQPGVGGFLALEVVAVGPQHSRNHNHSHHSHQCYPPEMVLVVALSCCVMVGASVCYQGVEGVWMLLVAACVTTSDGHHHSPCASGHCGASDHGHCSPHSAQAGMVGVGSSCRQPWVVVL
jgi:hypothetical protein